VFCSYHRKSVFKSLKLSDLCFLSSHSCLAHSKIAMSFSNGCAFAGSKMSTITDTCPSGCILFPNLILTDFLPYTRKSYVRLAMSASSLKTGHLGNALPSALFFSPSLLRRAPLKIPKTTTPCFSRFLARKVSALLIIIQASF
jgi:hypothetical protein